MASDGELQLLIGKLHIIQQETGGKPAQKNDSKKTGAGADRFMEIKSHMMERLNTIRMLSDAAGSAGRIAGDPKEAIAKQQEIRQHQRELEDEKLELEDLFQKETKKKKSKFTAEELDHRQNIIHQLATEIRSIKDMTRTGYMKPYTPAIQIDDLGLGGGSGGGGFGGGGGSGAYSSGTKVTQEQQVELKQIDERNVAIDDMVSRVGVGVTRLGQIARAQNEETSKHAIMLDELEGKIENVHDHVSNVNTKMKDTLDRVGRSSGKLCVDVMCLIILLGVCSILYNQLS